MIIKSGSILYYCCCVVAGLGLFRTDDGRIEELVAVVFPPPADVCVPSSNSLLEVGISIKGVTPCPPAPPVTKGRTPSHLVVLSHSKYVGLFLSCWSIIVIACASPSACNTLDCLIPSALAMLAFCSPIALASFCCASICILLNSF